VLGFVEQAPESPKEDNAMALEGSATGPSGEERRDRVMKLRALEGAALRALDEAREGLAEFGEPAISAPEEPAGARLLNAREAAAFVGCHPNTIYNAARTGELRSLSVGRHLRFRRADLVAWAERRSA
jgi:excisionase family DNA binding protein